MDKASRSRGFSLVELLVVCAIIALVSGIMLANHTQYGGRVVLQNFAYDVALSIRQAQVYGISVKRFGVGASATFDRGYGMYFDLSNPSTYFLFADVSQNGRYDPLAPTGSNELVSEYKINRGYKISELCYTPSGGSGETCNTTTAGMPKQLHIVFKRPEPDALISACGGVGIPCVSNSASARIVLKSPRGETMSVSVRDSGQIAVEQLQGTP